MIKKAKLSNKCQITIPKEIRKLLEIDKGDSVIFYMEDNEVKLTSVKNIDFKLKNPKKKTIMKKGENNNG